MKILKGLLTFAFVLCVLALLPGCSDDNDNSTHWINVDKTKFTVSGKITLETGGPQTDFTQATVTLYDDELDTIIATTTPDENGNYKFTKIPNGDYVVVVTGLPGYADTDDTEITVSNADKAVPAITMFYGFTVSGQILYDNEGKQPATGIYVLFTQEITPDFTIDYCVATDADGKYITPIMEHGEWTMSLTTDEDGDKIFYEDTTLIDLDADKIGQNVVLKDKADKVTGFVVYGLLQVAPSTAVPNNKVELRLDVTKLLNDTMSDANGFYGIILSEDQMPASLEGLNWLLQAVHPTYGSASKPILPITSKVQKENLSFDADT